MEQTPQCVNNNAQKPLDQALSDYSPKDSKWDTQRATVQDMSRFLFEAQRFERWAERMDGCPYTGLWRSGRYDHGKSAPS